MPVVGIDLGGTKLAVAAFTENGDVLERRSVALGGRTGRAVGELIVTLAGELVIRHGADSIGICVPGLYRAATGTVWAQNIPGWDDYPLLAEAKSALGDSVRVAVDSDRAACMLGESWKGAAVGARDAVFIAVGTGIGAGILCDGAVLRGRHDLAGAIGWLALDRPFAERYAGHGHLEDQASGPGLVRVANDLLKEERGYAGELRSGAREAAAIFTAFGRGDAIATKVLENAVQLWGMAAGNLVSTLDPELVVFGGGVFGPAASLLPDIEAVARQWAQPLAVSQVRFAVSALGSDAALVGSGRLAMLSRNAA